MYLQGSLAGYEWSIFVNWQAIEFAKEQDDEDLWDDLIKYSLDKPGIHCLQIVLTKRELGFIASWCSGKDPGEERDCTRQSGRRQA